MSWDGQQSPNRVDMSMGKTDDVVSSTYRNYSQAAACSMEQIFTPINITRQKRYDGDTPGLLAAIPEQLNRNFPFGLDGHNFGPTCEELDPYFPTIFGKEWDQLGFFIQNCDYNSVVCEPSDDYNLHKNSRRNDVQTVRTQGLRTPVLLSGWGFDLADLPVPYASNNVYNFDPNLVNNRATWKTGPLAVQWDEERQVWSTGPHILCGILPQGSNVPAPDNPSAPTRFNVFIYQYARNSDITNNGTYPASSNLYIGNPPRSVTVTNRDPSLAINSAAEDIFVIIIRLNYEWLPLWIGCNT